MNRLLIILALAFLLMPFWVSSVSVRSWPILTKKIVIATMVSISLIFSIYVFSKTYASPTLLSVVAGRVAVAVYFIVVAISAYFSWPR
jgi:hypothetical protein